MDNESKINCFLEIYNKLNINKQKETIEFIKKLIINIETKYNNRIKYRNLYNISILNFDILLINYIIGYIYDFVPIVNFAFTCKIFYSELKYFLLNSNSVINNIFYISNNNIFVNYFNNSYYKLANLKYYFNTNRLPLPCDKYNQNDINFINNINDISIDNTVRIYCHYYFDKYMYKYHITEYYHKIFSLIYTNYNISINIYITDNFFILANYFNLSKEMYAFYNFNYYYYSNNLEITLFDSNLVSYIYNSDIKIFKYQFDIYKLLVLIKHRKYNDAINLINNLEFNYYYHITYLGLTYYTNLVLNARFFLNSNNFNKFIKVIFLSIYLEYFNNILNIINNNTNYDNIISDIKELVVDISNYYYNLKELRPRYCQTFIEHRYFNLLTNLANKLNIEIE